MRVTLSVTYRNFLTNLDALNQQMDRANLQISSGRKLAHLNDSPAGSAELVDLRSELSAVDQFLSNGDSGSFFLNVTDSALNSAHNLVTSIFTKGSAAASDTSSAAVRASAASEIRTLRDQILALANTEVRGRYIFAGSQVLSVPFTIAGDAVTYQGDLAVNSIEVSRGFRISQNVPGVSVFASVFNTIESLASALDIDDQAGIQAALGGFSAALGGLSRARAQVGSDLGVLQNLESELGGEKTNLRARQSRIQDANLAEAVTELTRIQTALKATLSAEAIVGKNNLFDFLA